MLFRLIGMSIAFVFAVILLLIMVPLGWVVGGLQVVFEKVLDYLVKNGEEL